MNGEDWDNRHGMTNKGLRLSFDGWMHLDRSKPQSVDECRAVDRVMVGLGNILVATIRDGAMKEARAVMNAAQRVRRA